MSKKTLLLLSLAVVAVLAVYLSGGFDAGRNTAAEMADTYTAARGRLQVKVTESAELYASTSVKLRCEIEGRTAILWLVEEGIAVKKGDKLVELDVSQLEDRFENQEITVSKARASKITADKNFEIQKNQNESDLEGARNKVLFAELELEKFMGKTWAQQSGLVTIAPATNGNREPKKDDEKEMGERDQQKIAAVADIEVAAAEVQRAKNRLKWTEELHRFKYVTDNDLEVDRLSLQKTEKQLMLSKNRLHILENYTLRKTQRELEATVKEARAELARTKLQCEARLATQQAELDSKRQQLTLEDAKLKKYREQINASVLRAPSDGLVIYATVGDRRRREPIDLGTEVREGQEIITLPDVTSMRVKSSIHEAQVDLVSAAVARAQSDGSGGTKVEMKVDAFPDRTFYGRVRRVGVVPDTNRSWFNPEIKLYTTHIDLEGNIDGLRPGQNATVEILVADLPDVLAIPIPAVQRAGRVLYVWKKTGSGAEPVPVETGIANDQFVHVTKGVAQGDVVYLSPPDGVKEPEFLRRNATLKQAQDEEAAEAATEGRAVNAVANRGDREDPPGGDETNGRRRPERPGSEGRPRGEPRERGERRSRGERGEGGNRGERGEGGEGGRQRGGMNSERRARFTAMFEAIKKRFPDEVGDAESSFALMRNRALLEKAFADPAIKKEFGDVIESLQAMLNRMREGGGFGGDRGGRERGAGKGGRDRGPGQGGRERGPGRGER